MAMQPAVCHNCGGKINVDDVNLNGFAECKFCGTSHKVIDVITIDGLPTVKSLLTSASISIDNGNYEKAVRLYNEVINIKPNCHEAWWGLYICNAYFDRFYNYKDKYGNSGPLTKASIMQTTIEKYAKRAIDYAPPQESKMYADKIKNTADYIKSVYDGQYDKQDSNGNSGCYIATAVYGSYTCAEVFALRKFRDDRLSNTFLGRSFIKIYYALSPFVAKHLPYNCPVSACVRKLLNCILKYI